MLSWWNALLLQQKIFAFAALPASLVLVLQLVLNMCRRNVNPVFLRCKHCPILSLKGICAFFATGGWTGFALGGSRLSVPGAVAAGVVGAALAAWVLWQEEKSGKPEQQTLSGRAATVYKSIPPTQNGVGAVMITLNGKLTPVPAVTRLPVTLPMGLTVEIKEQNEQGILLVSPFRKIKKR